MHKGQASISLPKTFSKGIRKLLKKLNKNPIAVATFAVLIDKLIDYLIK